MKEITDSPIERLANVRRLLAQVRTELTIMDWATVQCDDGPIGEHLVALEQHIDHAISRIQLT